MSAFDLIKLCGESVQVKRETPGQYVNGSWVDGTVSTFNVTMSVQPLTGDDLQSLPEGQRTRRVVKGYTDVKLRTVNNEIDTDADVVVYDDLNFEVQIVEKWNYLDLDHFYVVMVQKDET